MKNAYNTSAYGSFAYVYDIFMEGVHYEKAIKASYSFINSKDHCDSNNSTMHIGMYSDHYRDWKYSIRHSR